MQHLFWPSDPSHTAALVRASNAIGAQALTAVSNVVALLEELSPVRPIVERALSELEQTEPDRQQRILSSPLLRSWLRDVSAHLVDSQLDDAARLLRRAGAMLSDIWNPAWTGSAVVVAEEGMGWTWDSEFAFSGLACDVFVDRTVGTMTVTGHGESTRFVWDRDVGWVPASNGSIEISRAKRILGAPIVVRNDLPALQITLNPDGVPERQGSLIADRAVRARQFRAFRDGTFDQAATWLARSWPAELADWCTTLHVVVPWTPPTGWISSGFTLSSHQGACWIVESDPVQVFEALVHEQSHVKLRYVEQHFPLLEPSAEGERYRVGWRTDARPIEGVVEGAYVHLHCARALERAATLSDLDGDTRSRMVERADCLLAEVREATRVLEAHARFTSAGDCFLEWLFAGGRERTAIAAVP
jgi:HEXXH motif-containing protein